MANDSIFTLLDTAPQQSSPMFCLKGGTIYLYVWNDAAKKNDWRAGGRMVHDPPTAVTASS